MLSGEGEGSDDTHCRRRMREHSGWSKGPRTGWRDSNADFRSFRNSRVIDREMEVYDNVAGIQTGKEVRGRENGANIAGMPFGFHGVCLGPAFSSVIDSHTLGSPDVRLRLCLLLLRFQ